MYGKSNSKSSVAAGNVGSTGTTYSTNRSYALRNAFERSVESKLEGPVE